MQCNPHKPSRARQAADVCTQYGVWTGETTPSHWKVASVLCRMSHYRDFGLLRSFEQKGHATQQLLHEEDSSALVQDCGNHHPATDF
eukprot:7347564-Pyramimonas_sp.AAC.2